MCLMIFSTFNFSSFFARNGGSNQIIGRRERGGAFTLNLGVGVGADNLRGYPNPTRPALWPCLTICLYLSGYKIFCRNAVFKRYIVYVYLCIQGDKTFSSVNLIMVANTDIKRFVFRVFSKSKIRNGTFHMT